jgi:hypothetical protein
MFQSAKAFIGPTLRHPSRRATRSAGAAAVHASNGLTYSTPFRSISQTNHLFVKPTLSPSFRQNINIATKVYMSTSTEMIDTNKLVGIDWIKEGGDE